MKKIIFTLFLLIFSLQISAQVTGKFSPYLSQKISKSDTDEQVRVWIYFTDKGDNIEKKKKEVLAQLPENSIKRRKKRHGNLDIVDFYDIPVNSVYPEMLSPFLIHKRMTSRWLNALSADVKISDIYKIEQFDFVKKIDLVFTYSRPAETKQTYGCEGLSAYVTNDYGLSYEQDSLIEIPQMHDLGFTGNNVIICMADAGFNNLEHEVFENLNIIDTYDFVNDDDNVDDQDTDMGSGSHGTATLSCIGGYKTGQLIGAAYGASYLLAKTENTDSETQAEEDNWVAAVEWAEYTSGGGADITSTSLGYWDFDDGFTYTLEDLDGNTSVITKASDIAAGKGILVVNSAGNSGSAASTLMMPADGDSVLTVGAVDFDGIISSFSSRGPTGDGRIKPDVCAPGVSVYVAGTASASAYVNSSGTSFSCPLTAGAAALLIEAFPNASNMDIYDAVKATASHADSPDNDYGWGVMKTLAAYNYLLAAQIRQIDSLELRFSPNPVSRELRANINIINSDYQIFDRVGNCVISGHAESNTIDVSNLKNGIYFINIYVHKKLFTRKFIKSN